ncbi:MAG: anthranilate synthase component I [Bdellovibrionota bacterium]
MNTERFKTQGGVEVQVETTEIKPQSALDGVFEQIDTSKGAIFSSGFDYPGRHSRWDLGFVNPAIEFIAHKKQFTFNALNEQGRALLTLLELPLKNHPDIKEVSLAAESLTGEVKTSDRFFTEEERSRQPSIFSVLRAVTQLFANDHPAGAHFGFYGAFGYDLVTEFEDLKLKHPRDARSKDCHLFLPLELTVVDRKREISASYQYSVLTPQGPTKKFSGGGKQLPLVPGSGSKDIQSDHEPGEFAAKVQEVIGGTARGDYFEVVLSQTFSTRCDDTPTALFRKLAKLNPSPYMFLLNMGDEQLVGASPELFVRVTGRRYETCPIAGTIARGKTALEDADRVQQLMGSRKDESELTMCTDVDRNDMARVCIPGSVRVIGRRQLEFYSHLIHTVDHVEGYLRDELDALDAFQTHMWACTVTGAPKPAALQEIENLEKSPRGWYSGAIGFLCFNGSLNTGITLRTASLKDGRATLRSGATLLFGSDPDLEELETRTKAAAFLAALAQGPGDQPSEPRGGSASEIRLNEKRRILLVDYKDSFVHNLAAYLRELGAEVLTVRAGFPESMIDELKPDLVLLSPGPGTPQEFGVPDFVGRLAARKMPTFGVCLGHQGIGQHFGATIGQLPIPEHGKASVVHHQGSPMFSEIEEMFEAGRYHSLYLVKDTVPDCLEVTAYTMRETENGEPEVIPMAVRHKTLPIAGVQFHPESLMTLKKQTGHLILKNAIDLLTR